jgi:hypothetical protein
LIGAARGIAVARADNDRRGLGQGGDVPRRPLQPVRSLGIVPGGDRAGLTRYRRIMGGLDQRRRRREQVSGELVGSNPGPATTEN